jgi:hypothetical protein
MPGGGNTGGVPNAPEGQPLVGGGESFGSPATRAGASPEAAAESQRPGDTSISPDADDGEHTTMGGSGSTGGGH